MDTFRYDKVEALVKWPESIWQFLQIVSLSKRQFSKAGELHGHNWSINWEGVYYCNFLLPDKFSSQRVQMKPNKAKMIMFLTENLQSANMCCKFNTDVFI